MIPFLLFRLFFKYLNFNTQCYERFGEVSILTLLVAVTKVDKDLVIHYVVFNTEKNWEPCRYSIIINWFISCAIIT